MITFDDFKKLEIKIGTVVSVEKIPETDKLLKFVFDLGDEKRQILAGMAEFFSDLDSLIGKEMPILTNIEPREIKGFKSEGMIMAVDVKNKAVLLKPEKKVPPGSIVR
jgi:methionine--tRNA ligase beta chain